MKERPILFSAPMVRAIIEGRKTQTRRIVKHFPAFGSPDFWCPIAVNEPKKLQFLGGDYRRHCPYGQPGDRLWAKETWSAGVGWDKAKPTAIPIGAAVKYNADAATGGPSPEWIKGANVKFGKLRPCLFMRRWMSRITLEIVSVRVERLNHISEADSVAEGVAEVRSPDMLSIFTTKGYACDIGPNYVHGVPEIGDDWGGHKVTHIVPNPGSLLDTARDSYRKLWESINGPGSWQANPFVWVITFKRV